ncbi:MAG: hypothetical protein RR246_01875 [Clostridia bacterium]
MNRKKRIIIEIAATFVIATLLMLVIPQKRNTAFIRNYTADNQVLLELTGEKLDETVSVFATANVKTEQTVSDGVTFNYDYGIILNGILYLVAYDGSPFLQNSETGKIYEITAEQRKKLTEIIS